jgi:predicted HNH restriction endonuclease
VRVPSTSKYRAALQEIGAQITPLQLSLLEAHYLAPHHTASSEEIALAAGKPWQVTNAHYGRLGTNLRRVLGLPLRAGEQQSTILAFFERPTETFSFCRWIMHPPLAKAIREVGWFGAEDAGTQPLNAQLDNRSAREGQKRRRLNIHRARESSLRRAKIEAFRREHQGRIFCEVPGCGFDFEVVYGDLGRGFAEVHHLKPLAELDSPVYTTLGDLAVVCANCHRMIHRNSDCRALETITPILNSQSRGPFAVSRRTTRELPQAKRS